MTKTKRLYFAYGSNMDQARLEARVGKVVNLGKLCISGWKLTFNCGIRENRFTNIVMTGNILNEVEGVLYELTAKQLRKLDWYEGLYQKIILPYKSMGIYVYACLNPLYIAWPEIDPTPEYVRHLFRGCEQNNLHQAREQIEFMLRTRKYF